jgi:hypothetical protein
MTSPKRPTGYLPDPVEYKRKTFHHLAAQRFPVAPLAPDVSLSDQAPAVMDQGSGRFGTGSCTGHAIACAACTTLVTSGHALPFVISPAEIYRNGRAIDRGPGGPSLIDDGAQPNQVWRAVSTFGVRAIKAPTSDGRYSDAEPATINDEPTLGDLEDESRTLLVDEYGISSRGARRVAEIKIAINGLGYGVEGVPLTAAIAGGSDAFQAYAGGVLGRLDASLDHYVAILGYRTRTSGKTEFLIRNSWGIDWGLHGDCWIDEDALDELGDIVAADVRVKAGS